MSKPADEDQSEADSGKFVNISGHTVVKGPKPFSTHIDKSKDEEDE